MKLRLTKDERLAIGSRIRELRGFYKLEQGELASKAGVSQAVISQYEKGLTEPSLFFIKFLAENYGISGDWLIFGSGRSPYERKQKEMKVKLVSYGEREPAPSSYDFVGIPLLDADMAAFPGKIVGQDVEKWELVHVKEITGRENLVAIELSEDHVRDMEPIFHVGAKVVIDKDDKKISPKGYYALNTRVSGKAPPETGIECIRKLNLAQGRLWLIKENPTANFEFIDLAPREKVEDLIVGRVVWMWWRLP